VDDLELIGGDGGGELAALADHELGPPLLDHGPHRRQHRVNIEACEDRADDDHVALSGRLGSDPGPDRAENLVGWVRTGPERIARRIE